jgi:putative methyltransferase (TIGR04325 family)
LSFYEHVEETEACDALLCSGSLQYVDWSIEDLIGRLPRKPYMIFLNKVPVSASEGFFTLETFVKTLPCRIFGPNELEAARQHLGYKLAASWPITNRDFVVLSSKGMEKVQMVGEAWVLQTADA